jgi:hypothetical protein
MLKVIFGAPKKLSQDFFTFPSYGRSSCPKIFKSYLHIQFPPLFGNKIDVETQGHLNFTIPR